MSELFALPGKMNVSGKKITPSRLYRYDDTGKSRGRLFLRDLAGRLKGNGLTRRNEKKAEENRFRIGASARARDINATNISLLLLLLSLLRSRGTVDRRFEGVSVAEERGPRPVVVTHAGTHARIIKYYVPGRTK